MNRPISRRLFLGTTAAGMLATQARGAAIAPQHLGVELYTVRTLMPAKDDVVLHQISEIGYRELEGDYPTLMRISSGAKVIGLDPISCHIPLDSVNGKGTPLEKVFADLQHIGTKYAVVPYIPVPERKPEILSAFGDKMNKAGELAKKHQLQFAYHNHAFEWGQMNGKRVFDVMFSNTDPKLVQFEADVFWLSVGGVNPVKFLEEHKGRVPLVHLKDKAQEQQVQYNENVPKETFKEVGNGSLDMPAIIKAAQRAGTQYFFVEQDQTPGDPLASLKQSFAYINGLHG